MAGPPQRAAESVLRRGHPRVVRDCGLSKPRLAAASLGATLLRRVMHEARLHTMRSSKAAVAAFGLVCACAAPPPAAPGVSRTYVISTITFGPTDPGAHGLDLDARIGGDPAAPCTDAEDSTSTLDGAQGIDAQALGLWPVLGGSASIDDQFRSTIQEGYGLIVLEVGGIDDFTEDPSVEVRLVVGAPASGSSPIAEGEGLAPGQPFEIRNLLRGASGRIHEGRLRVTVPELPLSLTPRFQPFVLHDVRIEADLSDERLERGEIGGSLRMDELTQLLACGSVYLSREEIEAQVLPDLDPEPPEGLRCLAISTGIGFEGVSAVLIDRYAPLCTPVPLPAWVTEGDCSPPAFDAPGSPSQVVAASRPLDPALWILLGASSGDEWPRCAIRRAVELGATYCARFVVADAILLGAPSDVIEEVTRRADVTRAELDTLTCF